MTNPFSESSSMPTGSPGLPRWARRWGLPLLAFVLTLTFIFLGLPLELFEAQIQGGLKQAIQASSVEFEEIGPTLSIGGPAFAVSGIDLRWSDGRELRLDKLLVRPAWALSWFRAVPAVHADIDAKIGGFSGTAYVSREPRIKGSLSKFDVSMIPTINTKALIEMDLSGTLDGDFDITLLESGPEGEISFSLHSGTLIQKGGGFRMVYDDIRGRLRLGDDVMLEIIEFAMLSDTIQGELKGIVGKAPTSNQAPLELFGSITETAENMRPMFKTMGIPLDHQGRAEHFTVTGTVGNQIYR